MPACLFLFLFFESNGGLCKKEYNQSGVLGGSEGSVNTGVRFHLDDWKFPAHNTAFLHQVSLNSWLIIDFLSSPHL